MSNTDTCPYCGADRHVLGHAYKCGSNENMTSAKCYVRHLADQAAEIERLKTVLTHIAEHGGTTDDESGLSHNGSWCAEQARCALEVKR